MENNFSVLISVYCKENAENFRQALQSVFSNTLLPNEVVLVEDGPLTPELYKVVRSFKEDYPNVLRVINLKENGGLGNALRIGIEHCSNELIARMDSDDLCTPDRFTKQIEYLKNHPYIDVLGGIISEFDSDPTKCISNRVVPELDKEIKSFLKYRCPFNHVTVIFKKSKVLEVGSYEDFYYHEDYYLWIKMSLNNCVFHNLQTPLVLVRAGSDMLTRRGGVKYVKYEKKILSVLLKNKIINRFEYIGLVCAKASVRVLGHGFRKLVYKNILRS